METETETRTMGEEEGRRVMKSEVVDLGNGSQVVYVPRFFSFEAEAEAAWVYYEYLNKHIPWTRPTIRVFARQCLQVHRAFPGSCFNSVLLNRYKGGNDYVGWHADDEKLYGPTPEIASVSFGCDRDFLLKKKPSKVSQVGRIDDEPPSKRSKTIRNTNQHSFTLKHGSLLLMRGYTQRDWLHSVPKRAKADSTRINLTFRRVL